MSLTVQNLRAVGTGVEPASLLPGQIAFNITDKVLYVGDGSNFKTDFEGNQVAGVPGEGWYAMPMDFGALGDYYVANPEVYGDVPTDQQILTWSDALNHPIWTTGSGGGGNQVYVVTNAQVASASGATTSDKITAAIGVASPDEGDVTIVTGLPDDVYEGLYFFTTSWVKGAAYAYPSASEVIYDNTGRTIGATVQLAINDLDDGLIATTAIANTANSTANSALSIASAALPRAGGVMTGNITFQNAGQGVTFNGGSAVHAVSDSISTTSSTTAASSTAVKTAYDLAAAAVPRSSFVSSGDLLVGTGAGTFSPLPAGAADYILASDGAGNLVWVPDSEGDVTGVAATAPITVDNTDPQVPVIGVDLATTATPGVVQVGSNIQVAAGVISIPDSSTGNKGVVQLNDSLTSTSLTLALTARAGADLQSQIDSLTLASNVTLAGSLNASSGFLDSVTSQGGATVPPFVAGAILPSPQVSLADYYVLVTTAGSYLPPGGGGPYATEPGDWLLCGETFLGSGIYVWQYLGVGARPQPATYTTAGIVQLADTAVTYTGTSDTEAVTPNSLQDKLSDSTSLADSNRIASSTAVKTAYDAAVAAQTTANAALPKAGGTMTGNITFQDAGEGVIFSDLTSVVAISDSVSTASATTAASATAAKTAYDAGIQGQTDAAAAQADADQALLDAAAAQATANAAVPCASFLAKGNILGGTAAGTYSALTVGSNGQVLLANSACAEGLEWGNACYVPDACFTAKGQLIVGTGSGTYVALTPGSNGQLLVPNSACTNGVEWVTCQGVNLCGFTCTLTPFNTALGSLAGAALTGLSVANTAIGYAALDAETSGDFNVAVGHNALTAQNGATGNVAVGANAGAALTAGANNILVGYGAGDSLTIGSANVAIGKDTLASSTGASNSVAIGNLALTAVTTGANNVGVGAAAGAQVNTGASNTLVGATAGDCVTTGSFNVAVGFNSLGAASTNGNNVAVGSCALAVSTAPNLVAVGHNALLSNTSGTANTALGYTALSLNITGSQSTAVGYGAGQCVSGNANTLIGYNAGNDITTGICNTILGSVVGSTTLSCNLILAAASTVKFQANASGAWSADGINYGTIGQVLTSNGTVAAPTWNTLSLACVPCAAFVACGDLLVGTGSATFTALPTGTNGQNLVVDTTCTATGGLKWVTTPQLCGFTCSSGNFSVALGFQAGGALTPTGFSNVFVGYNAGCQMSGGDYNVAVGNSSLQGTGSSNVAIGAGAMGQTASTGNNNVAIGYQSADALTSGANNIAIGQGSLGASTTASDQVAIGHQAGCTNTVGAQSVYVGSNAGLLSNSVGSVFVGFCAGQANTTAGCGTYLGYVSGRNATGLSNTYVGALTGCAASNTSACGTFLGFCSGSAVTTGNGNNFIGFQAGRNVNTGGFNVAIGTAAFQTATTATNNVAVGCGALAGLSTTAGNTALGHRAMINASTAANNVVIGCSAGEQISTGSTNVFIGNTAGDAVTTGSSNTIIGDIAGSAALADNLILAAGTTIKLQVNENGAVGVGTTPSYGTAGQVLQSNGTAAVPTWVTPQTVSTTATKATTSGTPINLLSWTGSVRMGDLTIMATDNATNVAWGNITIASDTGAGSSVVTTSGGTFGTFAVISGGGGETIVQFTPSATLATVNFVYKYTASFGAQPTVL